MLQENNSTPQQQHDNNVVYITPLPVGLSSQDPELVTVSISENSRYDLESGIWYYNFLQKILHSEEEDLKFVEELDIANVIKVMEEFYIDEDCKKIVLSVEPQKIYPDYLKIRGKIQPEELPPTIRNIRKERLEKCRFKFLEKLEKFLKIKGNYVYHLIIEKDEGYRF